MNRLLLFIIATLLVSCDTSPKETKNVNEIAEKLETSMKPVLIHTVFFWTKEGTTDAQKKAFEVGLEKLGTCPQIGTFYWGPPAPTEKRDVVDNSYDYAINVHFNSLEDQAAYQAEPIHLQFIEDHKDIWGKVIVYDNTPQ